MGKHQFRDIELVAAAAAGDDPEVKKLLKEGVVATPVVLQVAAKNGRASTVKLLIDHGVEFRADADLALRLAEEREQAEGNPMEITILLLKHYSTKELRWLLKLQNKDVRTYPWKMISNEIRERMQNSLRKKDKNKPLEI
jgi:hypothetical protein